MKRKKSKGQESGKRNSHPFGFKRRAAKLYVEGGYPAEVAAGEMGIG
jgi:transposase-like protein